MILVLPRRRTLRCAAVPETAALRERLSLLRLQRLFILALNTPEHPFPKRTANWEMEMNAPATKLQAVENDLNS